ncbi:iron-containing alcohol dehydrogenase family protein [Sporolactobacillus terrae]|uniref:iron-containing alcohol dehydrogenase family protein n=1 Tax=Sporolactobacillus terrae TaxID=269673 RepID=UPI00049038BB|nr:iron-containing alcohol dehydrogenase family protein [Sporolactobacillus terrae]UAK15449.1 iron-containing alcohol dehydrogenase family protein [Sporolactobacillus terrae]
MDLGKIVRGGPSQYLCSEDAICHLDELTVPFASVHIITGKKSFTAFQTVYQKEIKWPVHHYDGTSSHEDMDRLTREIGQADLIIAIGGGRVLDTAKGVNHRLRAQYICIPTVLGTCSAYTPLAIIYNQKHEHVGRDHFQETAYAVLVDLSLLIDSPKDYYIAGIGDTLAKWYEAEAIRKDESQQNDPFVSLGLSAALQTKKLLLQYSEEAVTSMERHQISPAFRIISDVIVGISGTVGSFARDYGRASGAHAIHNAMIKIQGMSRYQHGIKVAYGLLVLLATLGQHAEVRKLLPFYRRVGLIDALEQFRLKNVNEAKQILAKECVETEIGFRFVFKTFDEAFILNALNQVETLANESSDATLTPQSRS